jgi:hypothetical protein
MSNVILSASKIKTAESCSWKYWAKYHLNIPEKNNDGARRGSICHNVFEYLSKQKTKKDYNKIVKNQDPMCVKNVREIIVSQASRDGIDDEANISEICLMIMNGLSCDFYGEELGIPSQAFSELAFDIEKNGYHIRGFIDQLFLYEDKKIALVRDYKSSKKMFDGKEVEDNLQDYMYCLAVRHLFPDYSDVSSEFLFLKFIKNGATQDAGQNKAGVIRMKRLTDKDLQGFEIQLAEVQSYLENFTEKDAKSNFAYDQDFPSDNSFGGKLSCGFAQEKGQMKKDGTPMWHCPFRHDFKYYKIFDETGNFVSSCIEEDFVESMIPKGGKSSLESYLGCPRHHKSRY